MRNGGMYPLITSLISLEAPSVTSRLIRARAIASSPKRTMPKPSSASLIRTSELSAPSEPVTCTVTRSPSLTKCHVVGSGMLVNGKQA